MVVLTLSTKNAIDGDTLEQSLKHLTKAFDRLSRYKRLNKILLDLCVQQKLPLIKMMVVIISICTFCYVLKMHILEKENYITQEEWVNLWQKALQVDYRPVANIKAIKPNQKGDKDIESAIKETSKYSVKSSDF